ncbi:MAG: hypothetical protein IBJ09_12675 [Bacteroidia bacterium]|nr:hypothetical protein [Bacteroidia bacterium]
MNKIIRIFLTTFLLASCGTKPDVRTEKLNAYLDAQFRTKADTTWRGIVVLTMNGCFSCNRYFLESMTRQPDISGYAVLVSASPGTIPAGAYEGKQADTVWKDYQDRFYDTQLMKSSGIIYLRQGVVDTIVDLRSEGLEQQVEYMQKRFATAQADF